MKKNLFRNYYTRLICVCYAAVFCMILFAVCLILYVMNVNRINQKLEQYDTVLTETVQNYEEIWEKYYLTFGPIYEERNREIFMKFCEGELTGFRENLILEDMSGIFSEICRQDGRIRGIYFWRCADDTRYLYFLDDGRLRETEMELEGYINVRSLPALVGARTLRYGKRGEKDADVFGLQSRVLTANDKEKTGEYQITMLYDAHCFDQSLKEAAFRKEERFLIMAQNGMVLYDSVGDYLQEQAYYFEDAARFAEGENYDSSNGIMLRTKSKNVFNGKVLIGYVVPQYMIDRIVLDGNSGVVLIIALGINGLLLVVLLMIKRLFDRKFAELESGISQIGKSNLEYRIPVSGQDDEFSRIAVHFNEMCDDLQAMINKYYVYQMLQQKAEYQALKTRVNPHFLYNSLEMIREMLVNGGRQDEADVVVLLSRIFDYQIHSDSVVDIWMEAEVLQNYIEFLAIRAQYSFDYKIEMDDEILNCKIPKQILQPIAEVCFEKVLREKDPGFVAVCGGVEDDTGRIRIAFRYIGRYADKELADRIRASLKNADDELINLENVYKRLHIFFGEDCSMEISEKENKAEVTLELTFGKVESITG